MVIPKGIHPGLGMEQYHAWELNKANLKNGPISCSVLKDFVVNPYAWMKSPKSEATAAMNTGSLLDMALTDPGAINSKTAVSEFDSFRTNAAKEWRDEQLAQGKLIVSQEEIENALSCAKAVLSHDEAGKIMEGAQLQVGVVGEIAGIPSKCLIDILPSEHGEYCEHLFDYKAISTGLDDESVRKAIGKFRYHWQGGFYRTQFNKVSPDRLCEKFGFIFQDPQTREVRVVILSDDALSIGTRCVGKAVEEFVRCAHTGIHSRYRKGAETLDLMPYTAMNEDEWLESYNRKETE